LLYADRVPAHPTEILARRDGVTMSNAWIAAKFEAEDLEPVTVEKEEEE